MPHPVPLVCFLAAMLGACTTPSARVGRLPHDPSPMYPFGRLNPEAPPETAQFAFLIGHNDCREERLNNATGEWVGGERSWDASYYLDGYAVQDSGSSGGATNGNIRIYDPATEQWHVTYFSTPVYGLGTWSGGMVEDRIELERPQKAPGTDLDGTNRLTFYDITDTGFKWKGQWISEDSSFVTDYWRISCTRLTG